MTSIAIPRVDRQVLIIAGTDRRAVAHEASVMQAGIRDIALVPEKRQGRAKEGPDERRG
jgi:hypothetical protein